MAARNNVPVIPVFITMQDSDIIGEDGFPVQEYIINIEEPIYPSENLTEKGNTNVMRDKNFEVWKNVYEKFYKIPLEYLTTTENEKEEDAEQTADQDLDTALFEVIKTLKKGSVLPVGALDIKEGETSPPKRYNSGSIILAMENAGQLIEDEDLRAQIKGSGIGTSATRAEILKKLIHIKYLALNKKTQIITPTLQGEMVFDVVDHSIKSLLNPELTASWEKGLTYVAEGSITPDEYMMKLDRFITNRTVGVKGLNNQYQLRACYDKAAGYYKKSR